MTVMVSPRDIPTENLSGNVVHNSWAFLISTENANKIDICFSTCY